MDPLSPGFSALAGRPSIGAPTVTSARNGSSRPTVSVVVPCFNGEAYLAAALGSALEQTHAPLEILVIDDGSTDGSARLARSFGSSVRVICQENQGESVARNRGFELAEGDWVAFLDADDLWHPEKLAAAAELVRDGVVCVHTAYYKFGGETGIVDRSVVPAAERYRPRYVALHNFLLPSTAMVRRDARARFPTWTRDGEDLLFFLDLLREGEFRAVAAPLTGHRCHAAAQSATRRRDLRWRASVRAWLDRGLHGLPASEVSAIRAGWDRRVARAARAALWDGRVEDFRAAAESFPVVGTFAAAFVTATAEDLYLMPRRTRAARRRKTD
jgi:glycosyltransferase involved in cell wall biosynthesis